MEPGLEAKFKDCTGYKWLLSDTFLPLRMDSEPGMAQGSREASANDTDEHLLW